MPMLFRRTALAVILLLASASLAQAAPATIQNTTEDFFTARGLIPGNYGPRKTDCRAPYHEMGDGTQVNYTWDKVVLENDFVRVDVLPLLGGRILRFVNKTTGSNQFYDNPAGFKTNFWGRLGWTCTGGVEFMMPLDEHHGPFYVPFDDGPSNNGKPWLIEDHPVDFSDGVRLTMVMDEDTAELYNGTDSRFRLEVIIGLKDDEAAFTVDLAVDNENASTQRLQFWSNAMISPGPGNMDYNGANLNQHIVFPQEVTQVYDHNDNGGMGPGTSTPWESLNWPVHDGLDISRVQNFHNYSLGYQGTFVGNGVPVEFGAVYNLTADEGIAKTFPPQIAGGINSGLKFWHWGGTGITGYTNGSSTVMEIMTGPVTVFQEPAWCTFYPHPTGEADSYFMPGTSQLQWTDKYLTPHGIGDVAYVTDNAAMNFLTPSEVEPGVNFNFTAGVSPVSVNNAARIAVAIDGQEAWSTTTAMGPGTSPGVYNQGHSAPAPFVPAGNRDITLTVLYDDGAVDTFTKTVNVLPAAVTPTPTVTPTATPSPTVTPTLTPSPTGTPTPFYTATPTPTATPTLPANELAMEFDPDNLALSWPSWRGAPLLPLEVRIRNAQELKGFDFTVDFDPAVWTLEDSSDITMGAFLGSAGADVSADFPFIDNNNGTLNFGASAITAPYASGDGDLAWITWKAKPVTQSIQTTLEFTAASALQSAGPGNPTYGSVQIFLCHYADQDCNDQVNVLDIQSIAAIWNQTSDHPDYNPRKDINGDGEIDIQDIQLVAAQWGNQAPF